MCAPIWFRPVHEKIVRERLPEGSAFYGERLLDFVYWIVVEYRYPGGLLDFYLSRTCFYLRLFLSEKQRKCDTVSQNDSISHFFCFYCLLRNTFKRKQGIKTKTPQDTGILPLHSKLYPAISPNRRRIRPRSRPRTISCGLGRSQIGAHMDLHKLYPCHPHIKVLRSFFKSDRLPSSPPFPSSPRVNRRNTRSPLRSVLRIWRRWR